MRRRSDSEKIRDIERFLGEKGLYSPETVQRIVQSTTRYYRAMAFNDNDTPAQITKRYHRIAELSERLRHEIGLLPQMAQLAAQNITNAYPHLQQLETEAKRFAATGVCGVDGKGRSSAIHRDDLIARTAQILDPMGTLPRQELAVLTRELLQVIGVAVPSDTLRIIQKGLPRPCEK